MALASVLVSALFLDPSGNPLAGQVTFSLTAPLADPETGSVVPISPITIGLDGEGKIEVSLFTNSENGGAVYDVQQRILTPFPVDMAFTIQVPPGTGEATLADLMTTKQQVAETQRALENAAGEARKEAFQKALEVLMQEMARLEARVDEALTIKAPDGRILSPAEIRKSYAGSWPEAQRMGLHNSDADAHAAGFPYLRWGAGEPSDSLPSTVLYWLRFDGSGTVSAKTRDHVYFRSSGTWLGLV